MASNAIHTDKLVTKRQAFELGGKLIDASVWFNIEPWPEDMYLITVKREAARFLA